MSLMSTGSLFGIHCECAYLYRTDIGILCGVFVLVESIFGQFTFLEVYAELNELYHDRFEGSDGAVSGSFRRDMFV